MKTLLQYLTSQWSKLLLLILISYQSGYAKESHPSTLFETLETNINNSKKFYPQILNASLKNNFDVNMVKDINEVSFSPSFINMIILHNKNNVLNLGLKDKCALVDLLNTNLLYSPEGKLKHVIFRYQDKKSKEQIAALKKQKFLDLIGFIQCPKSKNLGLAFTPRHLRKTLANKSFKYPRSKKECFDQYKSFVSDPKSPYLCNIAQRLKELPKDEVTLKNLKGSNYKTFKFYEKKVQDSQSLKKIINPDSINYLNIMCKNSNSSEGEKFCKNIFEVNYWFKAISDLKNNEALPYYCSHQLGKKYKEKNLKSCIGQLNSRSESCHYLGEIGADIYPKPDCNTLSNALSYSRLYTNYRDCPAKVGNSSLVTVGRILNHINQTVDEFKGKYTNCTSSSLIPFLKFDDQYLANQLWDVKICYDDKLQKKEICYPTSFDHIENSKFSITYTVGKILSRLRGFDDSEDRCKFIEKNKYRPNLLEYKTGCYIIADQKSCSAVSCDFKVIHNDLEFKKYRISNNLNLDLLPFRHTEENRSFIQLIERHLKKKAKTILNISSFKRIFQEHKKSIFLGVGCIENLQPEYFKSHSLNQCTRVSFIIDGIIEDNGRYSMITRTSLDNLHAPRIISWNYIFNAVKNYQNYHPLNQWGLYAIY